MAERRGHSATRRSPGAGDCREPVPSGGLDEMWAGLLCRLLAAGERAGPRVQGIAAGAGADQGADLDQARQRPGYRLRADAGDRGQLRPARLERAGVGSGMGQRGVPDA